MKPFSISMDGKGRALNNIYIERLWRAIKYQHIYLNPADDGISLYQVISCWVEKYKLKPHQGISRNKPMQLFKIAAQFNYEYQKSGLKQSRYYT